jgi:hypothetical protein
LKVLHLITLFIIPLLGKGQTNFQTIGDKNLLRVNSNGVLAVDLNSLNPSFNQDLTNNHFLSQAGIWIVAEDYNGQFFTSIQHLKAKDSLDFWPGPVDTFTLTAAPIPQWDKVWNVDAQDIDYHKHNYQNNDYILSEEIKNWPVPSSGQYMSYLAPFIDANTNGKYDPENGDYPYIKGEKALYCIFNDLADEHTSSFGAEVGLEVHLLAYTISGSNSIFLEYFIVPRRSSDLKEIKVGFFLGGECGNPFDNYVGTNASFPPSVYVYNGDALDEGYFGNDIPYVSATFLNENLDASIAFSNDLSKAGAPNQNQDYINYLNHKWKDGSELRFGGNGQDTGTLTNYIYPQSTYNQNIEWSEESASNLPGVRNILGITAGRPLAKDDYIKLDICLAAGTKNTTNIKEEVINQTISDQQLFRQTSNENRPKLDINPEVYPNPSSGSFKITNIPLNSTLKITDYKGVTVFESEIIKNSEYQCNINLTSGIYMLELMNKSSTIRKTLCITP